MCGCNDPTLPSTLTFRRQRPETQHDGEPPPDGRQRPLRGGGVRRAACRDPGVLPRRHLRRSPGQSELAERTQEYWFLPTVAGLKQLCSCRLRYVDLGRRCLSVISRVFWDRGLGNSTVM